MSETFATVTEDETRKAKADGLRELADLIEQVPEFGDEFSETRYLVYVFSHPAERLAAIARALPGRVDKLADDDYFGFTFRLTGGSKVQVYAGRSDVCERVVTGKRTVEKPVMSEPVQVATKRIEEDIVEWRCVPLLARLV